MPAFVADGSIIPLADPMQSTAEYGRVPVTFRCYGTNAKGTYYEDDGQSFDYETGSFNEWRLKFDDGKFVAQPVELGFEVRQREYRIEHQGKRETVELLID